MTDSQQRLFSETLVDGAAAIGVALTGEQIALCLRHAELILETNAHTNLTRITEPAAMAVKHFVDSLTVLAALPDLPTGARVADIGTGAGFPGIPLKIVRPDLHLTLIDSLRKRLVFLEGAVAALGLENIALAHTRVEETKAQFDLVVARAVAPLERLIPWCAPRVAPGGRFVAMKGGDVAAEREAADAALARSGLRLLRPVTFTLPDGEGSRRTVLIYGKGLAAHAAKQRP